MINIDKQRHLNEVRQALINIGIEDHQLILVVMSYDELKKYGCFADEYIDLLFDVAGKDKTIIMNSFSWNFCQTKEFDINKTPGEVGLSSEILRRTPGVIRSPHPLFSLIGKGPLAQEVLRHDGPTCWGDGTPAEEIIKHNALCISIGKEFPRAITILHSFEEWKKVPYRHFKTFSGKVNFGKGFVDYSTDFYVRNDQSIKYSWKPAVDVLLKRGLVRGSSFDLPIRGVLAKDLQRVGYQLLDDNPYVFVVEDKDGKKDDRIQ